MVMDYCEENYGSEYDDLLGKNSSGKRNRTKKNSPQKVEEVVLNPASDVDDLFILRGDSL